MKPEKMKELKSHLQAALACLGDMGMDEDEGSAPESEPSDDGDDDYAEKSLGMKLSKYKRD